MAIKITGNEHYVAIEVSNHTKLTHWFNYTIFFCLFYLTQLFTNSKHKYNKAKKICLPGSAFNSIKLRIQLIKEKLKFIIA